jgi:hypothetical protein
MSFLKKAILTPYKQLDGALGANSSTERGQMEIKRVSRQASIDRRTAFHEAGHAVMLILTCQKFTDISLERKAGIESRIDLSQSIRPWHYTMLMLSGRIVEEELCRGNGTPPYTDDIEQEIHNAAASVRGICQSPEEGRLYFEWCRVRATNLLRMHWPEVERIAAELLNKRTISCEKARKLFYAVPKQRPEAKFGEVWKKIIIAGLPRGVESTQHDLGGVESAAAKESRDFDDIPDQAAPVSACLPISEPGRIQQAAE